MGWGLQRLQPLWRCVAHCRQLSALGTRVNSAAVVVWPRENGHRWDRSETPTLQLRGAQWTPKQQMGPEEEQQQQEQEQAGRRSRSTLLGAAPIALDTP